MIGAQGKGHARRLVPHLQFQPFLQEEVAVPNSGAPSRFWAFALAAAIIGALAFAAIAAGDQVARQSPPLADTLDRLAERAGFGVEQVDLTGHRMTPPDQIFAALNLA